MAAKPTKAPKAVPGALSADGVAWTRVMALHAQVDNHIERVLRRHFEFGLSEFLALAACAAAPDGELRIQELATAVNLNQSSVSRLISRLERTELTERRLCEYDRRGVYTGITERGIEIYRQAVPVYETALRDAFTQARADATLAPLADAIFATYAD
jgi:DNA-binding MarR family transcriptional regulator